MRSETTAINCCVEKQKIQHIFYSYVQLLRPNQKVWMGMREQNRTLVTFDWLDLSGSSDKHWCNMNINWVVISNFPSKQTKSSGKEIHCCFIIFEVLRPHNEFCTLLGLGYICLFPNKSYCKRWINQNKNLQNLWINDKDHIWGTFCIVHSLWTLCCCVVEMLATAPHTRWASWSHQFPSSPLFIWRLELSD